MQAELVELKIPVTVYRYDDPGPDVRPGYH
jgi:hypothetical protein